jgi:hypothetical protein
MDRAVTGQVGLYRPDFPVGNQAAHAEQRGHARIQSLFRGSTRRIGKPSAERQLFAAFLERDHGNRRRKNAVKSAETLQRATERAAGQPGEAECVKVRWSDVPAGRKPDGRVARCLDRCLPQASYRRQRVSLLRRWRRAELESRVSEHGHRIHTVCLA